MSREDQENAALRQNRPPSHLLERYVADEVSKEALDIACGTGRHALWLAKRGWKVDAVDFSPVALQILTERIEEEEVQGSIHTLLRDLDDFSPPSRHYDLILMSNYLDRPLIRRLQNALKPGGLFFVETYLDHPENQKKSFNPNFLLQAGELKEIFSKDFEILHYEEFPNETYEMHRMMKAAIVAKAPSYG